jgi:hypothetical protein
MRTGRTVRQPGRRYPCRRAMPGDLRVIVPHPPLVDLLRASEDERDAYADHPVLHAYVLALSRRGVVLAPNAGGRHPLRCVRQRLLFGGYRAPLEAT